jgi:hypothetical protein
MALRPTAYVTNWFSVSGNQLDFVQFTDQTLTSAQINALFGSGLLSSAESIASSPRPSDSWDRSLALFADAMNHFGQRRELVVDRLDGAEREAQADWLASGRADFELGARFRGGVADGRQQV